MGHFQYYSPSIRTMGTLKTFSFLFGAHLEFLTTMTKLTLMSTFWLLIGAATVLGMPEDPTDQLRVNVKVNTWPKTSEPRQIKLKTGEDSNFDLKIQELADKAERGNPLESDVKELVEAAKKNPRLMKKLKGFFQDAQKKPMMLKKRILPFLIAIIGAGALGGAGLGIGLVASHPE